VPAALPKSAHSGALAPMKEIYNAENIDQAKVAIKAFEIDYGATYLKAVAKILDDANVLLEFYKYPPNTGSTCAPPTRSSPHSPPSGCGPRAPDLGHQGAPDLAPQELPWPTS
jgi:hypothetical protein